jgi:hypothetical protein
MAKNVLTEDGKVRSLFVSFEQEYDSYNDTSTGGGNNDGYVLEVSGLTVTHDVDGTEMRSEWSSPNGLGSLRVYGRTSRREGGSPIRCGVEYRDMRQVTANEARQMVKVFDKIERSLSKADERDGYHKTIGQYLSRVARAVGATLIVFEKHGAVSTGGSYDGDRDNYVFLSLGNAVDAIDSRINLWVEKKQRERNAVRR